MSPVLVALLLGALVQAAPTVQARPQPAAQGDVVVFESSADPRAARIDGVEPLFFPRGEKWVALFGVDAEAKPGRRELVLHWDQGETTLDLQVVRKKFPRESLKVEPKYVEPPAEVLARITAEKERLDRLWERSSPDKLWRDAFRRPVVAVPNSGFGLQRVFNGQPRSPHNGVDFPVGAGVPVTATNDGVVAVAEELYFTGNTVIIDHGLGLYTTYAHLAEIDVHVGQKVAVGAILGKVGATGRATGPHLHWGARLMSARVDPMQLLALQSEEGSHGTSGR